MTPEPEDMSQIDVKVMRVVGVASIEVTSGPSDGQLGTVLKLRPDGSDDVVYIAIPEHDSLFLCEAIPGALRMMKAIVYRRENPDEFPDTPETPQGTPVKASPYRRPDAGATQSAATAGIQNGGAGAGRSAETQETRRSAREESRQSARRLRESVWFTLITIAGLFLGLALSQTVHNILVNFLRGMVQ